MNNLQKNEEEGGRAHQNPNREWRQDQTPLHVRCRRRQVPWPGNLSNYSSLRKILVVVVILVVLCICKYIYLLLKLICWFYSDCESLLHTDQGSSKVEAFCIVVLQEQAWPQQVRCLYFSFSYLRGSWSTCLLPKWRTSYLNVWNLGRIEKTYKEIFKCNMSGLWSLIFWLTLIFILFSW